MAYKRKPGGGRKPFDLRRELFGRLQPLEIVGRVPRHVLWRCLCVCGKQTVVRSGNLLKGNTQSCGCLHFKRNRYGLTQATMGHGHDGHSPLQQLQP
jgi:hypothetical protein